jgi:hypothetical protein
MNVNGDNWFPYVPPGWLDRLVELIRHSTPQRITVEWCMEGDRFRFSESNARHFMGQIRAIGWINENGALTDRARNLRLQGEAYQRFMGTELARVYDELEDSISGGQLDREQLNTYFTSASSLGLSGRRQVISAFRWFLREAGLAELNERLGGQAPSPAPRARRSLQRQVRPLEQPPNAPPEPSRQRQVSIPALGPISLSISLQLPAVDDERVYHAIFKAMRESLFTEPSSDT